MNFGNHANTIYFVDIPYDRVNYHERLIMRDYERLLINFEGLNMRSKYCSLSISPLFLLNIEPLSAILCNHFFGLFKNCTIEYIN